MRVAAVVVLLGGLVLLPVPGYRASAGAGSSESSAGSSLTVLLPALIDAGLNNIVMAGSGSFALVAPFGGSSWLTMDDGKTDLERSASASNLLWSVDTATGEKVDQAVVGYFPSRIAVARDAGVVAVRHLGMSFDSDGAFAPKASLTILKVGENGRLQVTGTAEIPAARHADGVTADGTAPDDVFVSKDGRYAFVTNGAAVLAYQTSSGRLVARKDVVLAQQYGWDNEITSITFHAKTGDFGVMSGNSIFVNDAGPDSESPDAPPVLPVDTVSFFRFVPPAVTAGEDVETAGTAPAFSKGRQVFFIDYGFSAGSNVEFDADAKNAFVYSSRLGMLFSIDVESGVTNGMTAFDFAARDADDLKSVRTLVYSAGTQTLAVAVTGKILIHPVEYAKRITSPGDLAHRITSPGDLARKITSPGDFTGRRGTFDSHRVSPRLYLVSDGGRGAVALNYSITGFGNGTTISAPAFRGQGSVGYFASTDGHLYSVDASLGTLLHLDAPGVESSAPALSDVVARAALVGGIAGLDLAQAEPATGSITIVRSLAGSR